MVRLCTGAHLGWRLAPASSFPCFPRPRGLCPSRLIREEKSFAKVSRCNRNFTLRTKFDYCPCCFVAIPSTVFSKGECSPPAGSIPPSNKIVTALVCPLRAAASTAVIALHNHFPVPVASFFFLVSNARHPHGPFQQPQIREYCSQAPPRLH